MSLQKLQMHIDECTALVELHDQATSAIAKGTTMLALDATEEADKRNEIEAAIAQLQEREEVLTRLLQARLGGNTFEEVGDRLHLQLARMEKARQIRGEMATLRVALELEIAVGGVKTEQRREAEAALTHMQQRYETLLQQGMAAIPGPKLVLG